MVWLLQLRLASTPAEGSFEVARLMHLHGPGNAYRLRWAVVLPGPPWRGSHM